MADIPITLTCADYARVMPLVTGDLKPDGVVLTMVHGTGGSWEVRAEMLRRALDDPTVQGGEASMAGHLRRIDRGDAAMSGCRSFRCATLLRAVSMCAKGDRSNRRPT